MMNNLPCERHMILNFNGFETNRAINLCVLILYSYKEIYFKKYDINLYLRYRT